MIGAGIGHNRQKNVIDEAIASVGKLPGLGPRSAKRIVLHLLRHPDATLTPLLAQLQEMAAQTTRCSECGNIDVSDPCHICQDVARDTSIICVVEDVADVWAMERSQVYRGVYHVLGGVLSAIDGVGPDALGIPKLLQRIDEHNVSEVILATNSTTGGQTTAHYLHDALSACSIRITRLAQGMPMGGELDYVDEGTLAAALRARSSL